MKYILLLLVCSCHNQIRPVPPGQKPCTSDVDCGDYYFCGFTGVDTYPVCIYQGPQGTPPDLIRRKRP